MKAHIVGGGFGGLAAAFYPIPQREHARQNIVIYEAARQMSGGLFSIGGPGTGYNMPGSVFDREFRCTFQLFQRVPSAGDPSVTDVFFAFHKKFASHVIISEVDIMSPRFCLPRCLQVAFGVKRPHSGKTVWTRQRSADPSP
jgi:oleate hydratase